MCDLHVSLMCLRNSNGCVCFRPKAELELIHTDLLRVFRAADVCRNERSSAAHPQSFICADRPVQIVLLQLRVYVNIRKIARLDIESVGSVSLMVPPQIHVTGQSV